MPTEINRRLATKTFATPAGNIKVPVITEITFQDASDRYQESRYTIDNSGNAYRDTHVAWVATDPTNPQATEHADRSATPPSGMIAVERIDQWRKKDSADRYQETFSRPDNETYNPSGPPYFRTHLKTHVVNYRKTPTNPNDTALIASELIDEFVMVDPSDRYQETHFYLRNPQNDDEANAQITPDLPDITDTANGVDPPYRTDPFQNIVRVGGQPLTIGWYYENEVIGTVHPALATGYHFKFVAGYGTTSPITVTLPDGRTLVISGNFPVVSDVIFPTSFPPGVYPLSWAWWHVGGDGSDPPFTGGPAHTGLVYYEQAGGTFSHTWQFYVYTYTNANYPTYYEPWGTLSVTFGPISLTVDGVPYTLTKLNVSMYAEVEPDHGIAPSDIGWAPNFSATFEPP